MEDPGSPRFLLNNILANTSSIKPLWLAVGIASFVIIIILTGVISLAETAFVSSSHANIEHIVNEKKSKKARRVLKMQENPNRFLSTIQVINTLFSFINGAITSSIFIAYTQGFLPNMSEALKIVYSILITVGITILTTYFQIVFAELVPKRVGMKLPEKTIIRLINFVLFWYYLFYPFVWFLTISTTGVARIFGVKKGDEIKPVTEEDIKVMAAARGKEGAEEAAESNYINSIFEFNDTTVKEIMTHRTDVAAIDIKSTKDEVFNAVKDLSYTRYPVYEGTVDNIVGVLHVKDLTKYLMEPKSQFKLTKFIREVHFVYEGKKINELFKEMKANKLHLAVVVDEYGGTAGIVTLEDVIEEVFGDIDDEYDTTEQEITKISDTRFEVVGHIYLEELESEFKIDFPEDEYDTLSGFMISQYGKIPEDDDVIEFEYEGYKFRSLIIEDFVVQKVLIEKLPEKETEEN